MSETTLDDDIRTVLAEFWLELLELAEIADTDRFLELGGNSLKATMLANRIELTWGFRPSMEVVFASSFDELVEFCAVERGREL
ncbi:phosphopantetheine-binding protein [Nocardia sp. bgisy134]|uniref:phosphopantetheine-binding protein n=1 Tax=Nocardia sp. bgisy134 TaxID=3413789 RepID=UPI003D750739